MREFKGTSGQWEHAADYDNNRLLIYAKEGIQPHVCEIPDYFNDDDVMEANARLISIAPELLGILKYIVENDDGVGICLGYQSRELAETVIKKALATE